MKDCPCRLGLLFLVDAGPDWAVGIVQDFGSHRTQQEAPEPAMRSRRHKNQVDGLPARETYDLIGWISAKNRPAERRITEVAGQECVQLAYIGRVADMQNRELGTEEAG